MHKIKSVAGLALVWPFFSWAQTASAPSTPASMVVTVGRSYQQEPPIITRDDLIVKQQSEPLPVIDLIPLRGARAGVEIFLLVDSCSSCEPGSKFEELRRFIGSQPSTTAVGVAYIERGRLKVAENPTQDRECAVNALSAPAGSNPSNPFEALTELIKGWAPDSSRHAVLMISNGIDPAAADELEDPTVDAAIEAAQRAGVTVYAIYHPSADYLASDSSTIYSGQLQLAHLALETGGEAYFLSFGPLPSLEPFLADIADHLANQYLLEFLAKPVEGSGRFVPVTVKGRLPDLDLRAPDSVWVSGRVSDAPGALDREPPISRGERP